MSKISWSFRDSSGEISTVELNLADVAAGGANFDSIMSSVADLGTALGGITTCQQAREVFNQAVDVKSPLVPTDSFAKRESGLRLFYADDTTGEVYHITIPGPDWDSVDVLPNTDLVDMTDTEIGLLVTEMEAEVLSPVGNSITVLRGAVVGRHN